jgi:hypothetical protein
LINDIDATITIAHSEKINAEKTWKKTFGFHPLLAYLDLCRAITHRGRVRAVAQRHAAR